MRAIISILSILFLFVSCQESNAPKLKANPLNLTLVLDMSNRIHADKAPSQAAADLVLVKNVFSDFKKLVASKGYVGSSDRLTVAHCYGDSLGDKNEMLSVDVSVMPLKDRRMIFNRSLDQTFAAVKERYAQIATQQNEGGANLYGFFKDDFQELVDHQNQVMLLTDGYMNFSIRKRQANQSTYCLMEELRNQENWQEVFDSMEYGFLSVRRVFPQTKIHVIGVNPRPTIEEFAILKAYWQNWFITDMRMKGFQFQKGLSGVQLSTP